MGENALSNSFFDTFKESLFEEPPDRFDQPDELADLCNDPMPKPIKLIDEGFSFTDLENLRGILVDNSGFLVVGVVGLQGVGKSSVANLLANRLREGPPFEEPFPVQTVESLVSGYPRTTAGVDIYVTQDRVIILDTQPLLSWGLTDLYLQGELQSSDSKDEVNGFSKNFISKPWCADDYAEITSLQIIAFLASVCHVVVCVQDNLSDVTPLRLLDRGFGWRPLILVDDLLPASGESRQRKQTTKGPALTTTDRKKVSQKGKRNKTDEGEPVAEVGSKESPEKLEGSASEPEDEEAFLGVVEHEAPGSQERGLGQSPLPGLGGISSAIVPSSPSAVSKPTEEVGDTTAIATTTTTTTEVVSDTIDAERPAPPSPPSPPLPLTPTDDAEVVQQAEVLNFFNYLQQLTDYCASVLWVYNCAPVSAFLEPPVMPKGTGLPAYRRLLAHAMPRSLELSAQVAVGPRILANHVAATQGCLRKHARPCPVAGGPLEVDVSATAAAADGDVPFIRGRICHRTSGADASTSAVTGDCDSVASSSSEPLTEAKGRLQPSSVLECDDDNDDGYAAAMANFSKEATEEEVVAECLRELQALRETQLPAKSTGNSGGRSRPPKSTDKAKEQEVVKTTRVNTESQNEAASTEPLAEVCDTADVLVDLKHLGRQVGEQRRSKTPRLFLLPITNEKGQVEFGSATYGQCAYLLQEAIFSTPRRHPAVSPWGTPAPGASGPREDMTEVQWLEFARSTWNTLINGEGACYHFNEYHRLFTGSNSI